MEELSIKEKAQRYDEAIERVVNIRTGKCETTFIFTEGLFNYLFPELEECNGEEVRKAMIDFFKHEREEGVTVLHYGVNIERMIAWLEKQKTSEEAIQYLKENHSPSEVSDFQTAMNIAVAKAYDKGVKDGLENRGQTFTKEDVDDAYLKGVRDAKKELKKISQRMISAEAKEAMYGKPIDKVEPKFRVGDVVCDKSCITPNLEIVDIRNGLYICDKGYIPISYQDEYELVAKKIENEIEIPFGAKDSELQEATYFIPQGFHAEIDNDKVVIKKGEKPTAWSEEDELKRSTLIHVVKKLQGSAIFEGLLPEELIDWLKSLKQRIGG